MVTKIAVVEDDEDILELIEYNLEKAGYETIGFLSTRTVMRLLEEEEIDLLLIDRNLPGIEGSEFVVQMRERGINIPVVYLTAKNKESDIEEGFMRGADDYVTKPFNMRELMLRIGAILRRTKGTGGDGVIRYRDICVNTNAREVLIAKRPIDLTKLEFDLLQTLISNQNVVLNRDFLLEKVWGGDDTYQDRTVNVAINRLKDKIDPDKSKEYIKTVRGVGYTLC